MKMSEIVAQLEGFLEEQMRAGDTQAAGFLLLAAHLRVLGRDEWKEQRRSEMTQQEISAQWCVPSEVTVQLD